MSVWLPLSSIRPTPNSWDKFYASQPRNQIIEVPSKCDKFLHNFIDVLDQYTNDCFNVRIVFFRLSHSAYDIRRSSYAFMLIDLEFCFLLNSPKCLCLYEHSQLTHHNGNRPRIYHSPSVKTISLASFSCSLLLLKIIGNLTKC